jgi:hypothetical protein
MLYSKTKITELDGRGVSIEMQQYVVDNGTEYSIGMSHRCAYVNSERGRAELVAEVPEPYLSAVMMVWEETPTVIENNGAWEG